MRGVVVLRTVQIVAVVAGAVAFAAAVSGRVDVAIALLSMLLVIAIVGFAESAARREPGAAGAGARQSQADNALPFPLPGGWAMDVPGLVYLLDIIGASKPSMALEFGSGTSSVWIGRAVSAYGGSLVSIEHSDEFASLTRQMLAHYGLGHAVDVRLAPLAATRCGGEDYTWYDRAALDDLRDIDLVLVDGPPGATGPAARYPALPAIADRLALGAWVILDDVDREDEKRIVDKWLAEFPGLRKESWAPARLAVFRYMGS